MSASGLAARSTREGARAWGASRLREAGLAPREAWVEADLLLRHAAGLTREEIVLRPSAALPEAAGDAYVLLVEQRAAGRPSAYLTGRRQFCGLAIGVDPRVLIPRPETEGLVEAVEAALASRPEPLIVDVGTGSGAIALALAHRLPRARIVATDVSPDALAVARANAERLGLAGRILWRLGDALHAVAGVVPEGGAAAICANPPYIPSAEVPLLAREIREHEPLEALDGGSDGLIVHRRIVGGAARYLAPGGLLVLETSALGGQAHAVAALIGGQGAFDPAEIVADYAGLDRIVVARRAA